MDHKLYKSILNQDQRNETSLHFLHKLISKGDIKRKSRCFIRMFGMYRFSKHFTKAITDF